MYLPQNKTNQNKNRGRGTHGGQICNPSPPEARQEDHGQIQGQPKSEILQSEIWGEKGMASGEDTRPETHLSYTDTIIF